MAYIKLLAACLIIVVHTSAQNLVPNPGFEEYYSCPFSFNNYPANPKIAPGWFSPSYGTPDLFNTCGKDRGEATVHNWAGVSYPHSGNGYAGIYTWMQGSNYREYLQATLLTPLDSGKRYILEFHFKLSSYSMYGIDRIGALLSDSIVAVKNDRLIPTVPTLSVILDSAITPATGQWQRARMEYVAHGGEHCITIGNFYPWEQAHYFHFYFLPVTQPMLSHSAYYYIDDVIISEITAATDSLLVWSDGREIKPEENYTLKNIQFEFNQHRLMPESFPELDKLASVLIKKPDWQIEVTGHTDDQGSEQYNLELSKNRAGSVGTYLALKGISKARIITRGFGESKPFIAGTDEYARTINRRVDVKFIASGTP